jgi:hypothetical protein
VSRLLPAGRPARSRVVTRNGVVAVGGRLTDWISLGVLAWAVPRDAVDEAIAAAGRGAKRSDGKLPPHVMVYFAMALALFAGEDYRRLLPGGPRLWARGGAGTIRGACRVKFLRTVRIVRRRAADPAFPP